MVCNAFCSKFRGTASAQNACSKPCVLFFGDERRPHCVSLSEMLNAMLHRVQHLLAGGTDEDHHSNTENFEQTLISMLLV
jgi:hypothetical protein